MKLACTALCILLLLASNHCLNATYCLSTQEIQQLGKKIWQRECGGTQEGLTFWKNGEEFPSFGIGHFIWFPAGQQKKFEETFPALLDYLVQNHVILPDWLLNAKATGCPWKNQIEFQKAQISTQMKELQALLSDTIELQSHFIVTRYQSTLKTIFEKLGPEKNEMLKNKLALLSNTIQGIYAVIDYTHFKGVGINTNEQYKQQGWGLLQVLEQMKPDADKKNAVLSFVNSAKKLLTQRVHNSPPERNESQWLAGWINRVEGYLAQV